MDIEERRREIREGLVRIGQGYPYCGFPPKKCQEALTCPDCITNDQLKFLNDRVVLEVKEDLPVTTLCDCGHYQTTHFRNAGACDGCACTWYYPNVGVIDMHKAGFRATAPLVATDLG